MTSGSLSDDVNPAETIRPMPDPVHEFHTHIHSVLYLPILSCPTCVASDIPGGGGRYKRNLESSSPKGSPFALPSSCLPLHSHLLEFRVLYP